VYTIPVKSLETFFFPVTKAANIYTCKSTHVHVFYYFFLQLRADIKYQVKSENRLQKALVFNHKWVKKQLQSFS